MTHRVLVAAAAFALAAGLASAQDAKAVLQKAATATGASNLTSIQFSGTGHVSAIGQNLLPHSPWPETTVTSYTRTIDFASKSSKEELKRTQDNPPAKGGGAPFAGEQTQVNLVSGQYAWNQPGAQPQPQVAAADERQLQIWLTPQGFIKGAMEGNATAKHAKGGTEISFTALGKYKIVGIIDNQGMVTKVDTWIPNPVLGDMLVETLYSDYKDFSGVKFPTKIVQNQGGHPLLELAITDVKANPGLALTVPEPVRVAKLPPVRVESQKVGDGAWWLGGGTHHSVVVEFKDYIAIVETPLTEERAEAVLAEARKLVPNKPIKYVINTHHHFDHSGGLRAVVAEGITIITNEQNKAFYEQVWKAPHTLEPDMLSKNPKKAKFITVKDKYELTDGTQTLDLYFIEGNDHNGDMMLGYLPKQKVLIEADLFTPGPPNGPPLVPVAMNFANELYANVQRLKLDVVTIAPLHGRVAPYSEMLKALGKSTS
jgi:glyoxylase-like metal-dependent hydrolase (beta-lactamase superfamily II)